ncbi:MAG: S8 family serine peptidase [Marinicellaceae bacterium]
MFKLFLICVFFGCNVQANVLSYQGQLTINDALANGQFDFDFEIFKDHNGNHSLGLYSLDQVKVIEGVFTAHFKIEPTSPILINENLWLQVSLKMVADTTDYLLLLPRQSLSLRHMNKHHIARAQSQLDTNQAPQFIALETNNLSINLTTQDSKNTEADHTDDIGEQVAVLKDFDQSLKNNLSPKEYKNISHYHDSLREMIETELFSEQPISLEELKNPQGNKLSDYYTIENNKILIDITTNANPEQVLIALKKIKGISVRAQASTPSFSVITIWATAASLFEMSQLAEIKSAIPVMDYKKPFNKEKNLGHTTKQSEFLSQGLANNQAEEALEVVAVRRVYNVDGSGIAIGVLSDSVDQLNGGISDSQATNDLPDDTKITVLNDSIDRTDEGRAMMELIHDISPNLSQIGYATAFGGEPVFASNITALANIGMDIIVDDVTNFNEPFFQDGVIAQAIDTYVSQGGLYFSSAGNNANQSYEAVFSDTDNDGFHNYSGNDELLDISVTPFSEIILILQWTQPWGNATTDLDLEIRDSDGNVMGIDSTTNNIGGNPYERIRETLTGIEPGHFKIAVKRVSGNASNLTFKLMHFNSSTSFDQFTSSAAGTISPHAATPKAFAIGAAPWYDRTVAESFSSQGPHKRFFDTTGNPIGPFTFDKPDFMGIDAGNTSFFFGRDIKEDEDDLPNFFGTSAAAPNVAAVAALMMQVAGGPGSLDYLDIKESFQLSAIDLDQTGFDTLYGHGLINALGAVTMAKGPSNPELTLYLNQFGDASISESLVSNADIDRIMYSSNVSGPTTIDITEIDTAFDPMVAVFVPDFDLRIGVDYNSGDDADDARFFNPNASAFFPYQFEVLSESEITEESEFIAYVDAPDQSIINRTNNINGNGIDIVTTNISTNGTAKYYQYTPPYNSSLDIRLTTTGFNGIMRIYHENGDLLGSKIVTNGIEGLLQIESVLSVLTYTIQVVPYRYIGTGDISLAIDFNRFNYNLVVNKIGDGNGTITSGSTPGIDCGADCEEVYADNTLLTLEAIPALGHTFVGWSGNCSEINSGICTVHMLNDNSVTAEFIDTDTLFNNGFEL